MVASKKHDVTPQAAYVIPEAPPPGWVEYTWSGGKGRFRYKRGEIVEIAHLRCYVEGSSNLLDLTSDEEAA